MVALRLGRELEMMVVGSPAYFARHGRPQTPRDLRGHRCLRYRWPTEGAIYRWEFERGEERLEVAVDGPLIVNDDEVAARAALDGLGLAYLFDYKARPLVESGRLVRVLDEWTPPFPGFHLYYPSRRHAPPALRAFIDFVARHGGDPARFRPPAAG